MLSQVDQHFSVSYEDGTLFLAIAVRGRPAIRPALRWPAMWNLWRCPRAWSSRHRNFLAVLKNAGNLPCTIRFAKEGVGGILIETEHGAYNYILRGTES